MKSTSYFVFLDILLIISCILQTCVSKPYDTFSNGDQCSEILPLSIKEEIHSYQEDVDNILKAVGPNGLYQGYTWNALANFIDTFGPRQAGTENLEKSIDYMGNLLKKEKFSRVYYETVKVPKWSRGYEYCNMVYPRKAKLNMLGLGMSIGTPSAGIVAQAIVVSSFEELKNVSDQVEGKIVVFNENYTDYSTSVVYRRDSAAEAAKYGALATLIRSITPFSINSPHTGVLHYDPNVAMIPSAAITVEDAHMLHRMFKRGEKIIIQLYMEASQGGMTTSRNTIAELKGISLPDEKVIVSGHLDSWDVGVGAMDDGGGAFISWNALALLNKLGLKSKRTLAAILWTGEEVGLRGAFAYYNKHQHEAPKINILLESDMGTFKPLGLSFAGNNQSFCIVKEVLSLLSPIGADSLIRDSEPGPDIAVWSETNVPLAGLLNDNGRYFWYHHSNGDTMDVEDPVNLDQGTAVFAAVSYLLGNLESMLPR